MRKLKLAQKEFEARYLKALHEPSVTRFSCGDNLYLEVFPSTRTAVFSVRLI